MIAFLILFFQIAWAQMPEQWNNSLRIVEKHEFYLNNEAILKPRDSWQVLFGIVYKDSFSKELKDCVYYYVPGVNPGALKIKKVSPELKCDQYIFEAADIEWTDLKSLQYSFEYNTLTLLFTLKDFSIERWQVSLLSTYKNPIPKLFMSSAEYRSGGVIIQGFQGRDVTLGSLSLKSLKKGDVCHRVDENCKEVAPSNCSSCEMGWYEIPNGCKESPKFCGLHLCGGKHQPACRRGMTYQKKKLDFGCRGDQSFVYCQKGLKVQCQGNLAYCL